MAEGVITWINGSRFGDKEIIPAAYCLQAISSQMVFSSNLPTTREPGLLLSNYGLGWFLSAYRSHYRVEHGGNTNGFSASTYFFPGRQHRLWKSRDNFIRLTNTTGSGFIHVTGEVV